MCAFGEGSRTQCRGAEHVPGTGLVELKEIWRELSELQSQLLPESRWATRSVNVCVCSHSAWGPIWSIRLLLHFLFQIPCQFLLTLTLGQCQTGRSILQNVVSDVAALIFDRSTTVHPGQLGTHLPFSEPDVTSKDFRKWCLHLMRCNCHFYSWKHTNPFSRRGYVSLRATWSILEWFSFLFWRRSTLPLISCNGHTEI